MDFPFQRDAQSYLARVDQCSKHAVTSPPLSNQMTHILMLPSANAYILLDYIHIKWTNVWMAIYKYKRTHLSIFREYIRD